MNKYKNKDYKNQKISKENNRLKNKSKMNRKEKEVEVEKNIKKEEDQVINFIIN